MSSVDDKHLMAHEYDGIREYDNPTPGWWKAIFIGSCVWALAYVFYYHLGGPGLSETEEWAEADKAHRELKAAAVASSPAMSEEKLAALASDAEAMALGKEVYGTYCFACHKEGGKGEVGPNLSDDFQIHGSTRMDMYQIVLKGGAEGKGMVPWEPVLKPEELSAVTAYVAAFRHTNVANGKAPEGNKVEPF